MKTYNTLGLDFAKLIYNSPSSTGGFNGYINFLNYMQLSVLNYVKIWPYLNISIYPFGYQIPVTIFDASTAIYQTVSGQTPNITGNFTSELIQLLQQQSTLGDLRIKYIQLTGLVKTELIDGVLGTQITFINDVLAPYTGRTPTDTIQSGDKINLTVKGDAIQTVYILYTKDNVTQTNFIYFDDSVSPFFPKYYISDTVQFYISANNTSESQRQNYSLANIYTSDQTVEVNNIPIYGYPADILFSFLISSIPSSLLDLSQDEVHNLFISYPYDVSLDEFPFNQYLKIALKEQWGQQRDQYFNNLGLSCSEFISLCPP
jgi:hypothetical protein